MGSLTHEIQHAVQSIEGFAEGGEDRNVIISGQAARVIAAQQIKSLLPNASNELIRAAELYRRGAVKMADNIVRSLSKVERKIWKDIKPEIDFMRKGHIRLFSTSFYHHLGGEIEARNVQAREHFTPEQRRRTPLADTQDENNWLITKNGIDQNFTVEQDYDYDTNSAASTNNFLTPEQLERYNQLVYHGTDNTILGNRFDLRFLGSSEGSASRGYGAYFAENLDVAQGYRHFGDEHKGNTRITLTTRDGKIFHSTGAGNWDKGLNGCMYQVFNDVANMARADYNHDFDNIKKQLTKAYRKELSQQKKKDKAIYSQDAINFTQEKINVLKSIDTISVLPPKNGNVYSFDIPENDMLLDWDISMGRQPEIVKKARREILQESEYWGLDNSEAKKAKTGEDFYRALTNLFRHSWDYNFAYPQSGVTDPQQRASLILNMHGVPGLRFLDSGSRANGKRKGTHNFVIWNADTIKMLGIMPDSNPDAIEHFNDTERQQQNDSAKNETYNQTINYNNEARTDTDIDTPRSKQILNERGNSFLTPEKYNQLMYHGTKNALLGNRFNLRYLSTGEGHQAFGYGAYLAQEIRVGTSYRKAGMSQLDLADTIFIMKNGSQEAPNEIITKLSNIKDELKKHNIFKDKTGKISWDFGKYIESHIPAMRIGVLLQDLAYGKNSDKYSSIDEVIDYSINKMLDEVHEDINHGKYIPRKFLEIWNNGGEKLFRDLIAPFIPTEVKAKYPRACSH